MHGAFMEHEGMDRLSVRLTHLGVHHVYILMIFLSVTHEPALSVAISITVPWDIIELHFFLQVQRESTSDKQGSVLEMKRLMYCADESGVLYR